MTFLNIQCLSSTKLLSFPMICSLGRLLGDVNLFVETTMTLRFGYPDPSICVAFIRIHTDTFSLLVTQRSTCVGTTMVDAVQSLRVPHLINAQPSAQACKHAAMVKTTSSSALPLVNVPFVAKRCKTQPFTPLDPPSPVRSSIPYLCKICKRHIAVVHGVKRWHAIAWSCYSCALPLVSISSVLPLPWVATRPMVPSALHTLSNGVHLQGRVEAVWV